MFTKRFSVRWIFVSAAFLLLLPRASRCPAQPDDAETLFSNVDRDCDGFCGTDFGQNMFVITIVP
jgi:hypothetical protein